PPYVSSVDSGNLCAAFVVLSNACRDMIDAPLPVATALAGIEDAVQLTALAAEGLGDERRTQTVTRRQLDEALEPLVELLAEHRASPPAGEAWAELLAQLSAHATTLADIAVALTAERGDGAGANGGLGAGADGGL